ncbi:hypothetical protein O6H91_10G045200 [Diphasiastrum complanatum]|uniref:Uncharacterized protein n=1 Tax=Diphasiastrum complanatum TaxID=34168 RepID=A0ACC2CGG0_DIPCM|nr:hypothetical protein O6H91_10G045200 [Diphasiastrum complanatum]
MQGESVCCFRMQESRQVVGAEVQQQGVRLVLGSMVGSHSGMNTVTPCAACKLLRRRCAQDCPFSPYFSPQEPQKFASVHKIFGASNVSKMLMEVPESQRAETANSLVYEANERIRDPVHGCMGTISALQQQTQSLQAELMAVRAEIMRYRLRESSAAGNDRSSAAAMAGFISRAAQGQRLTAAAALDSTFLTPQGMNSLAASDVKVRYW